MILAEVLGGEEDVIAAGSVKSIADGEPEVARRQRVDETQPGEDTRRFDERDELEIGLDVGVRFGGPRGTPLESPQMHFCSDAQMPRSVKTAQAVLTDRVLVARQ